MWWRSVMIGGLSLGCWTMLDAGAWGQSGPTFEVLKATFEAQFTERPILRGTGFNKFKRWEAYWEPRLLPDGRFPSSEIVEKAWTDRCSMYVVGAKTGADWTEVGPTSFVFAGFGGLGRVNCIAFHPMDPATFWAGTPGGGLWRTQDGGLSWATVNSDMPVLGVSDIAVDPTDPDVLYIATGDAETALVVPSSTKSIGVWKSIDAGATWSPTGLQMALEDQRLIGRLIIHPANPQVLFAAASNGVWRTADAGATWTNVLQGWFIDLEFKPDDPQVIHAANLSANGTAQVHRSTNGGSSWTQASSFTGVSRIALAVTPAMPDLVMAVSADVLGLGGLEGVYYSTDGGAGYVQAIDGTCINNLLNRSFDASSCGGQGVFDLVAALDPLDPVRQWVGGINLWRSGNGGANWQLNSMWTIDPQLNPNGTPFLHSDKHCLVFHPQYPNVVLACSDGGVHLTNDQGLTWYDRSSGMGISQMYRVGLSASEPDRALCGLQDNGLKQVDGGLWTDHIPGDHMECIIDPLDADVQYSCALTGLLYRTVDNWSSRELVANNIPGFSDFLQQNGFGPGAWVTPLVMDPADPHVLLIGLNEVWRTGDQGSSWTPISGFNGGVPLRSLAMAPSNSAVIHAGTYSTLYSTTNGGLIWSATSTTAISGVPGLAMTGVVVSAADASTLWAIFGGYTAGTKVFRSNDGGASWSNISGSLPNVPINCIVHVAGSNGAVYIGTDLGVFRIDDGLMDWEAFDHGLPRVQVNDLEVSYSTGELYAATFGRGLWSSPLAELIAGTADERQADRLLVAQGPFPGSITVFPPRARPGRIDVFAATGQRVRSVEAHGSSVVIDLGRCAPGVHTVLMNCVDGTRVAARWLHH
ncbi:MAG TPA: hypothetical protein PKE21_05905 [Flavobacteriales bacterium]|nr:hypothetical protein [Flavobacteriales bacterium]HMR26992.1 hypothetical protein [Flavobacteriales bacterium]